eukprot:73779-Pleurochrysis_carterae.AAC.1
MKRILEIGLASNRQKLARFMARRAPDPSPSTSVMPEAAQEPILASLSPSPRQICANTKSVHTQTRLLPAPTTRVV